MGRPGAPRRILLPSSLSRRNGFTVGCRRPEQQCQGLRKSGLGNTREWDRRRERVCRVVSSSRRWCPAQALMEHSPGESTQRRWIIVRLSANDRNSARHSLRRSIPAVAAFPGGAAESGIPGQHCRNGCRTGQRPLDGLFRRMAR